MRRLRRIGLLSAIIGLFVLMLFPTTALAGDPLIGIGVTIGGPGSPVNGGVGVTVGGSGGIVNGGVGVTVGGGGGGTVATGGAGVAVGGGGGVATGGVDATVGGGGGGGNGGGGSPVVDAHVDATVGGNGGSDPVAAVNGCVEVGGSCNGATTTTPVVGVTACVDVGGSCNGVTTTTPVIGVTACVVVDGACTTPGTPPGTTPPVVGVTGCVAVIGTCDGPPPPGGTGIGIGVGGGTPIGGGGICVVVLDSCTAPTSPTEPTGGPVPGPGGPTPGGPVPVNPGGPTPGGPNPGGLNPGGPITIQVTGDGSAFKNDLTANAATSANPALCAIPLTEFARDATMSAKVLDCATVHVSGSRSLLPAGYGQTQDFASAGAATATLGSSGRVLTQITGTCAGCETAFGSGSGYRSVVQLKDAASGDFINVGIVHEATAAATGEHNAAGLTLLIETGRKTATGYDLSQGYIATDANRVPGGTASILLAWNAQGVTVSVNGIVLPNESAPRAAAVGTYSVHMTQPAISFAASAKNPGERVDTTFKSISFG